MQKFSWQLMFQTTLICPGSIYGCYCTIVGHSASDGTAPKGGKMSQDDSMAGLAFHTIIPSAFVSLALPYTTEPGDARSWKSVPLASASSANAPPTCKANWLETLLVQACSFPSASCEYIHGLHNLGVCFYKTFASFWLVFACQNQNTQPLED